MKWNWTNHKLWTKETNIQTYIKSVQNIWLMMLEDFICFSINGTVNLRFVLWPFESMKFNHTTQAQLAEGLNCEVKVPRILGVSASVYVCGLRKQRVGTLVDLPFASVLPTISLAETKVQGRWLKQSVTKVCQMAQHNCDKNYVCVFYLAAMSTSSLRGRRDHDSCCA